MKPATGATLAFTMLIAAVVFLFMQAITAKADNTYKARVHRVMDGDTMFVCPLDNKLCLTIRVNNLNTPEKRLCKSAEMAAMSQCEPCQKGATLGLQAKKHAEALLAPDPVVTIHEVTRDRYGRTVADVYLPDMRSYAEYMIEKEYGAPYPCKNGRCVVRPRPWCAIGLAP